MRRPDFGVAYISIRSVAEANKWGSEDWRPLRWKKIFRSENWDLVPKLRS